MRLTSAVGGTLCLLLATAPAGAQSLFVGTHAGVSTSTMNGYWTTRDPVTRPSFGVFEILNFGDFYAVEAGQLFTMKGATTRTFDHIALDYVEFPVLLMFSPFTQTVR